LFVEVIEVTVALAHKTLDDVTARNLERRQQRAVEEMLAVLPL
jgi:hypothetical protein